MSDNRNYLTIHGHFYQPPRENPWLEYLELQESASPCHDWNERVCKECYSPNSISKIVGDENKIVDIVNNYAHMSYNFGPTLLSWLEKYSPHTYEQIIKADIESAKFNDGHGNAIAQVYNHVILPLANKRDKYTQVLWGIEDFKHRFGRMPEGIWLAETACDDETLGVLADCGIKFTILSPYQAKSYRKIGTNEFINVENGEIDTTVSYKYNIKSNGKSINLFFYNANISQAVAFEELLKDGQRFVDKLKTGIKKGGGLVNIATDGESYGHHTKFGDMALSYILKIKAEKEGFTLINYANFLEKFPPQEEVDIKSVSSWSCFHGVGRWCDDCGCSTGGLPNWNQKWRKPLREAFDFLRDKLIKITELNGKSYFNDVWSARNDYIHVVLNRNSETVKEFAKRNIKNGYDEKTVSRALKLMEIQRQAMLMYTSCGWFFNDISGIETVQIMKYAARAIQLAAEFSHENIEKEFLNILNKAESNIPECGTGKDIYERQVKPCLSDYNKIAVIWAVRSLVEDYSKNTELYSNKIDIKDYKKVYKGTSVLAVGRIAVNHEFTLDTHDVIFSLLQFAGGDIHCAVKDFRNDDEYIQIKQNLLSLYTTSPMTETIRALDKYFGMKYYTLKDIPIEERRTALSSVLRSKMYRFQNVYRDVYKEGKNVIAYMRELGLEVPTEFKLSAKYTIARDFNFFLKSGNFDENSVRLASERNNEANMLGITLDKSPSEKIISDLILESVKNLSLKIDVNQLNKLIQYLNDVEKLELKPNITTAQNIYFNSLYSKFEDIEKMIYSDNSFDNKNEILSNILQIGDKLGILTDLYKEKYKEDTVKK